MELNKVRKKSSQNLQWQFTIHLSSITTDGRTTEPILNAHLAIELRRLNPEWNAENVIRAEATYVIAERLRRLDILITPRYGVPVCIETEWSPAPGVEKDALSRLGANLVGHSGKIESVLAVKVDKNLSTVSQQILAQAIRDAQFEFCLYAFDSDDQHVRWPSDGWVDASLSNIADAIEFAVLSESRLKKAVDIVELAIQRSAGSLRLAADRAPQMLPDIAKLLHQQESEQTIRMAMEKLADDLFQLGASTIHDMAGQVFQRMIADRKFLATFYTKPTSALLIATLCVDRLAVDWSDMSAIKNLSIA